MIIIKKSEKIEIQYYEFWDIESTKAIQLRKTWIRIQFVASKDVARDRRNPSKDHVSHHSHREKNSNPQELFERGQL